VLEIGQCDEAHRRRAEPVEPSNDVFDVACRRIPSR
jgi:hypothetical protein